VRELGESRSGYPTQVSQLARAYARGANLDHSARDPVRANVGSLHPLKAIPDVPRSRPVPTGWHFHTFRASNRHDFTPLP
jgi:hypothetical protein